MSRQLKISTGVVQRLFKEVTSYQNEAEENQRKVDEMKGHGEDPYKIKQQEKVVQETTAMIPDTQKRLATALLELKDLMAQHEATLSDTEEFKKAEEAVNMCTV